MNKNIAIIPLNTYCQLGFCLSHVFSANQHWGNEALKLGVQRVKLVPDIRPFAAWHYRRDDLDWTGLFSSICLFPLAFRWRSHQIGEGWSSGHQDVLRSVRCALFTFLQSFSHFFGGKGNSFVLALDRCVSVLLWQKDQSLVEHQWLLSTRRFGNDCSKDEASRLEQSLRKRQC